MASMPTSPILEMLKMVVIHILFITKGGIDFNFLDHEVGQREYRKLMDAWKSHVESGEPHLVEINEMASVAATVRLAHVDAVMFDLRDEESFEYRTAVEVKKDKDNQRFAQTVKEKLGSVGFK
jgi:hypothetical protein